MATTITDAKPSVAHLAPPRSRTTELVERITTALTGGPLPVRVELWDGTAFGPDLAPATIRIASPDALRHLLWAPGELGLARAYVGGTVDIEGDLFSAIELLRDAASQPRGGALAALTALRPVLPAMRELGGLSTRPPLPPEEARPRGLVHSRARDAQAISHHYDVGNEFYRIVLGPSMTYSCARFVEPTDSLETAQAAKHELICRKLGLGAGSRLLDVGCGWGSLAMHAARRHGARVVGVTISKEQAAAARQRVHDEGLDDWVEIRVQDYRDVAGETFDAISSVGMFEHVGAARMARYFASLHALLAPGGRLLNHAISSVGGSKIGGRTFMGRYVFPDGELIDVGQVVLAMEAAGFEVRDVESLREHYARTLRHWVANLEAGWDRAVALTSEGRARVWRLYMAASAVGFEDGGISLHQVLGVRPDAGASGMPSTRAAWG